MSKRVGTDEAGRGAVVGPMSVAALATPTPEALPARVDDSKRLTPAQRMSIADELRSMPSVEIAIERVDPETIDDPETDMNSLTLIAQASATKQLIGDAPSRVYADACDPDEQRYESTLRELVPQASAVVANHRMDETEPVVAGASIIAKVDRDRAIESLEEEFGQIGSGYASDERTRTFLAERYETDGTLPSCARTSWQTCKDLIAANQQAGFNDF